MPEPELGHGSYTQADVGKLVRATKRIEEKNFNNAHSWVHARRSDFGRIVHVDRLGNPTVLFDAAQTATVVFDNEIEVATETVKNEEELIKTFFTVSGSCGCDGATDFGCPNCTPEKRAAFLHEFNELVKRYR